MVFKKFIFTFSLFSFFFFLNLGDKDVLASCFCNFSYCSLDSFCDAYPSNPYWWRGEEYANDGSCNDSSTCWNPSAGFIPCGNCLYGYGDRKVTEYHYCIASCGGPTPTPSGPTPTPSGPTTNVTGSHDGFEGTVGVFECRAGGWATDPDDTSQAVEVRFNLDGGTWVTGNLASLYRSDLEAAGVCPGRSGSCAFDIDLSSYVTQGVSHSVRVQAKDINTESFVNLSNTPRTINCSAPTCSLSLPPAISFGVGDDYMVSPGISTNPSGATVDRVNFSVVNASTASLCNNPGTAACPTEVSTYTDTLAGFQANLRALTPGTTTLTATGYMDDEPGGPYTCSGATSTVNVTNPVGWWQVKQGNIQAAGTPFGGNVTTMIPDTCTGDCKPYLIINDTGQYPGVVIATGSISTGTGLISSTGRYANAAYIESGQAYEFAYFNEKFPAGAVAPLSPYSADNFATCSPSATGYCLYRRAGNLTLTGTGGEVNIGGRRVVLLVEGTLNIETKIRLTKGTGFFMAVAGGDININPAVGDDASHTPTPDLEGIYFAGRRIFTGTEGADSDKQLYVRGMLVAREKVNLERNLSNNAIYPGDFIEYAPDQFLHFPHFFGVRAVRWREVAP